MTKIVEIDGTDLTIENVYKISRASKGSVQVRLTEEAKKKMNLAVDFVNEIVEKGEAVYGINTGFGALANKHIDRKDLGKLQVNLIRSHCTGVGEYFDRNLSRAIMILRANCLATGHSGIRVEAVQLLLEFLNRDITPCIPKKGSVGASGDLAPLSHIALCLIGEGDVIYNGKETSAALALESEGLKAIELGPKEGLALINGTAVMAALGSYALYEAEKLAKTADIISMLTLEATRGTSQAFHPKISQLKPHPGQLEVCENLNALIKDSEILESHADCDRVQDPYSLRCIPQVHGSCRQTMKHTREILEVELNSVTDNPLVFPDTKEVVSGGNFHGEALALSFDYLAMGLSELSNISERRVEKMMNPTFSELPAFLTQNSGLNSGLMIAHVTMAALASENKIYCHPASVDSIPTSTDKEDHVSMGVTAGRKLQEVLQNLKYCLAIELLCATQGMEFHKPLKSSAPLQAVYDLVRKHVEPIGDDRILHKDIENLANLVNEGEILATVEEIIGQVQ